MAVCVVGSFKTLFFKSEDFYGGVVWVYTLDSLWETKGKNCWCYFEIGVGNIQNLLIT